MSIRIVSDSASNLFRLPDADFSYVSLKINSSLKEYVDTPDLNLDIMLDELKQTKSPTRTSCPNVHDWLEAYGENDPVFAVTITSNLSGSCSAALQAASMRENVHVIDTLSAGPEMQLIVEKLRDMINDGLDFDTVKKLIHKYMQHTHLLFSLESLTNLARNGRINPTVAKIAGVLGIRVVGRASDIGTLEPLHKCRGEQKALTAIVNEMVSSGYRGGNVVITHCKNPSAAEQLKDMIQKEYPSAPVRIGICGALCSFYAELGGLLVGYEDL